MAEVGVDVICEIDWGRVLRQIDHPALRRQHINRVFDQFALELRGKLAGIGDFVLPFDDLAQPRDSWS